MDLLPQSLQSGDGLAHGVQAREALGHHSRHRFVVAGDDDFLAAGDAVQQFSESVSGLDGGESWHRISCAIGGSCIRVTPPR